jgi:hypothetical protein
MNFFSGWLLSCVFGVLINTHMCPPNTNIVAGKTNAIQQGNTGEADDGNLYEKEAFS